MYMMRKRREGKERKSLKGIFEDGKKFFGAHISFRFLLSQIEIFFSFLYSMNAYIKFLSVFRARRFA